MLYLLIPLLVLGVLGLAVLLWAAVSAPEGFEDETGFHLKPAAPPQQAPRVLRGESLRV